MSFFTDNIRAGASGASTGYEVERSLRFNPDDAAYLSRSAGSGSSTIISVSAWVKISHRGEAIYIHGAGGGSQTNTHFESMLYINSSGQIAAAHRGGVVGAGGWYRRAASPEHVLRDHSAWYHVMVGFNSGASGDSNKLKLYVNGVETDSSNGGGNIGSFDYINGNGQTQYIGRQDFGGGPGYGKGYIAELYVIDGTQLTPSTFIETDALTGQINPKNSEDVLAAVTLGTNGGYYNFSDNSNTTAATLGKDHSSNSNNFTPNNFSVSAGQGNDSLEDSPTNNFPTFNPLQTREQDDRITNGMLDVSFNNSDDNAASVATFGMESGKWYFEVLLRSDSSAVNNSIIGISPDTYLELKRCGTNNAWPGKDTDSGVGIDGSGAKYVDGSSSTYGSSLAQNDIIGIAVDADAAKVAFSRNGQFSDGNGNFNQGANVASGGQAQIDGTGPYFFAVADASSGSDPKFTVNFGQRAFSHTIPSGYQKLCQKNLPDPSIKLPNKFFDTTLYTGNGSTGQSITSLQFQPDWLWFKTRSDNRNHAVNDSVRGRAKGNYTDDAQGEFTDDVGKGLVSFDANGFTVGEPQNASSHNKNGQTIVNWAWKEDTSSGFDIVLHNVNQTGQDFTISHNLGVTPDAIFAKNRDSSHSWRVFHTRVGVSKTLFLDTTDGESGNSNRIKAVSSSNFTFRTNTAGNFVFYVFSAVKGFSHFGAYKGNGSSGDGPYAFTGFRPSLIIVKKFSGSDNWQMHDNKRDTFNPVNRSLFPNSNSSEESGSRNVDFLSNGFKMRNGDGNTNESGESYVFWAWAEQPFKYARGR